MKPVWLMFVWAMFAGCLVPAPAADPELLLRQAVEAHRAGNIDQAIPLYRDFLKARPSSVEAHSNLGAALANKGMYEDAIVQYQDALKLKPAVPGVMLNLALAFYKSGDISRAAEQLNTLNALTPNVPQVIMLLADCRLQLGENAKAVELLTPLAGDNPELAVAYLMGTALIRDKQMIRGQQMLERILKNGDSAEARLMMGAAKLSVLDYSGALGDLARAVELNPSLPSANSFYGQALMATGDAAGAAKYYRAELALNPNEYDANLNLGALLRQDGEFDAALPLIERALRVRPGDLRARYQIANIQLAQGKVELAEKTLREIVKQAPKFPEAHVSLATAYYRLKRKADGDRERALVLELNAEAQTKQPKGESMESTAKPQP